LQQQEATAEVKVSIIEPEVQVTARLLEVVATAVVIEQGQVTKGAWVVAKEALRGDWIHTYY
jgi:hypothetical protein